MSDEIFKDDEALMTILPLPVEEPKKKKVKEAPAKDENLEKLIRGAKSAVEQYMKNHDFVDGRLQYPGMQDLFEALEKITK